MQEDRVNQAVTGLRKEAEIGPYPYEIETMESLARDQALIELQARKIALEENRTEVTALDRLRATRELSVPSSDW